MSSRIKVSAASAAKVSEIVDVHIHAFPGFFLTQLGPRFLSTFYTAFLKDASAVALVAKSEDGVVIGFAAGVVSPRGFYRRLLFRSGHALAFYGLLAAFRNRRVLSRIFFAIWYRGPIGLSPSGALLSSIAVLPNFSGRGVGHALVDSWVRFVRLRGVTECFLTTDAVNNDRVIRFYELCGWKKFRLIEPRQDRKMFLMRFVC